MTFFFFFGCHFVGGFIYKSAVTALHLWGTVLAYLQVCQPCLGCGNKLAQLWMNEHTHTHNEHTHNEHTHTMNTHTHKGCQKGSEGQSTCHQA